MATYSPNYKPTKSQMALHSVDISPAIKTIVFWGGRKAVGKSAGGLGESFTFALKYPKAKCVIIGESLDNVKDSFLVKLPNLFPDSYKDENGESHVVYRYYEKSHSTYPSRCIVFENGSYITLQYCANIQDALAFQGKEYNLIVIDEVTRHEKLEIDLIESTLRASIQFDNKGNRYWIPTKMVLLGNPGGIGNDWVLKEYIEPCVSKWSPVPGRKIPLKTKDHEYWQRIPGREPIKVIQRFIQGGDNPFINSAYLASLVKLPDKYRKQYLDGDWGVISGKMFHVHEDQKISSSISYKMIKDMHPEIYVSIDWGYNPSYHSAHWHAVFPNKTVITFKEVYGQDMIFNDFVKEIALQSEFYEVIGTLLPHDMYRHGDQYRDDSGKVIGEMKSDVFNWYGLNPIGVASGTAGIVAERNSRIEASTKTRTTEGEPKFLISEDCPYLLEELDSAIFDEIKEGHVARGKLDHAIDDYGLFLTYYSDDISPIDAFQTEVEAKNLSKIEELIRKKDALKEEEASYTSTFYDDSDDFF